MKHVLTVSEGRKLLPRLLQEVARGGGPFYIGVRGAPTAVLTSVTDYASRGVEAGAGLAGEGGPWDAVRVELAEPDALAEDIHVLRRETSASATTRWDGAAPGQAPSRARKRKP